MIVLFGNQNCYIALVDLKINYTNYTNNSWNSNNQEQQFANAVLNAQFLLRI